NAKIARGSRPSDRCRMARGRPPRRTPREWPTAQAGFDGSRSRVDHPFHEARNAKIPKIGGVAMRSRPRRARHELAVALLPCRQSNAVEQHWAYLCVDDGEGSFDERARAVRLDAKHFTAERD